MAEVVTTRDGRQLAYLEVGDPHGPLVLHNHGGPSSRLEANLLHGSAQKTGSSQGATNPFASDSTASIKTASVGSSNGPQIAPETMNAVYGRVRLGEPVDESIAALT